MIPPLSMLVQIITKGEDYLISRIANPTIDDLDGNNCRTLNQIKAISKWDFRTEPSYVIIPSGAVIEGNEHLIPKEITVVLGKNDTVTWSNEDDVAHALVSNDKNNPWATGLMRPGESSSVKFKQHRNFQLSRVTWPMDYRHSNCLGELENED